MFLRAIVDLLRQFALCLEAIVVTILWIAGIVLGLLLLAYVALVISFVERKHDRNCHL